MIEKPKLSIVIPSFNEVLRLPASLVKIRHFLESTSLNAEIIVVDDNSEDETESVVKKIMTSWPELRLMRHLENKGKGAAVRTGIMMSKGQFILFTDADLSTPIEEVTRMMSLLENFDVVVASRRLKESVLPVRQPLYREMSGRIFSLLVRFLVIDGILDTQCGFKLFRAEVAKNICSRLTINGFGFDVEALYIAINKLGVRVKEFPVSWTDSVPTKVHLLRDSVIMLTDLFRIRINDLRKKYDAPDEKLRKPITQRVE